MHKRRISILEKRIGDKLPVRIKVVTHEYIATPEEMKDRKLILVRSNIPRPPKDDELCIETE